MYNIYIYTYIKNNELGENNNIKLFTVSLSPIPDTQGRRECPVVWRILATNFYSHNSTF